MVSYTLITFVSYLMWMLGGLAIHISGNMASGKVANIKTFKFSIFYDRNKYVYLYTTIVLIVFAGLFAISRSEFKQLPPVHFYGINLTYHYYLVTFGYTGGSAAKKILKKRK